MAFNNPIIGGDDTLVRNAIQSEGFESGVAGWRIERSGDAEFNGVIVRGTVETGTGGDGITIVPSPVPGIFFITSNTDEVAGANLGYDGVGDDADRWFVQGPDFGQGGDAVIFDPDPTNQIMTLQFNDFFQLVHTVSANQLSMSSSGVSLNCKLTLNSAGVWVKRGSLTALSLLAGWTNFGSGFQSATYAEMPDGTGALFGVISAGTATHGTIIANVPASIRPSLAHTFTCTSNGGAAVQLGLAANGNVILQSPPAGLSWVAFGGGCRWPIAGF